MPVIVQDEVFDMLPSPDWGSPQHRKTPRIKFEAAAGYVQQRERYPHSRYKYPLKWSRLAEAEKNILENWLDQVKSNAFWIIPPTGLWSGLGGITIKYCRVSDDEVIFTPLAYGQWSVEITVEEV
jgi:hypothetical protein